MLIYTTLHPCMLEPLSRSATLYNRVMRGTLLKKGFKRGP